MYSEAEKEALLNAMREKHISRAQLGAELGISYQGIARKIRCMSFTKLQREKLKEMLGD